MALETPSLMPDYAQLEGWLLPWEDGETWQRPDYLDLPLINAGRGLALMGDVRITLGDKDILDAAGGQIAIRREVSIELT